MKALTGLENEDTRIEAGEEIPEGAFPDDVIEHWIEIGRVESEGVIPGEVIELFGWGIGQKLIDAGFVSLEDIPADKDALMEIDGIGAATAERILARLEG